ncbi:MAG: ASCH domain-containing protein [Variovorax sp.]|nr:ASCH domain-containing protein [Variovorax sp.]
MKALSIRQPWAWLILNAGKDIENRQWWTSFRGPVLLHAAKGCTRAEYEDAADFAVTCCGLSPGTMPPLADIHRGGVVGIAEISDCVRRSDSPWFMGAYGFVLTNVRPVPFTPIKGALGFFEVDFNP